MARLGESDRAEDKTRPCPTCRMMISVLATKCRYCGAEVGRPKDAARHLTIDELGGETVTHYAPSSSVMEALESFRTEEAIGESDDPEVRKGRFRRAPSAGSKQATNLLDDAGGPKPISVRRAVPRKKASAWPGRIKVAGIVAGIGLVLYFGGYKVAAIIQDYRDRNTQTVEIPNEAPGIIGNEGPPLLALNEALRAQRRNPNAENEAILNDARAYLEKRVRIELSARPFSHSHLTEASRIASEAVLLDPHERIRSLKEEVNQESRVYNNTILQGIRSGGSSATFRLPDGTVLEDLKQGDELAGRFVIQRIGRDYVRLADTMRGDRLVEISLTSGGFEGVS